ncbi:MAG TPA: copper chaperone PCu(A)C [Gammaproteobacteria bacterium]|nr:copper chaperone PCu(A)C [Gammaproteobacteria bacterium]
MRALKPWTLLLVAITVLTPAMADGPSTRVSQVWIREAPPGASVLAAYFTLENLTAGVLSLDSVNSPDFTTIEIHQSIEQDGQESMKKLDKLAVPPHGSVEFKPGGYHLMLMQPHKALHSGDTVSLALMFSDGSALAILAPVRRDPPLH